MITGSTRERSAIVRLAANVWIRDEREAVCDPLLPVVGRGSGRSRASLTDQNGHSFAAWCHDPNEEDDGFVFNDTTCSKFVVESTIPKNTIFISPNPASDELQITFANPSDANGHLQVVNVIGQIVDDFTVPLSQTLSTTINVSNLSNGVYIIYASVGYDYVKQKVLVLH